MDFSSLNRPAFVEHLSNQQFDLLVVGGGITGCGIALDAALRGLKVALIEKADFASGTSSRSTKLIHGGLRYLKQMEIKLVRDVGSERAVVHRNARHIVIPERMLLPIVEGGSLGKFPTSVGLLVYDLLAGVKRSEQRKMLDRHQTVKEEPLLNTDKLLGGGLYFEYRTDDSRLVIELAKSAHQQGATLLNYAQLTGFIHNNEGKICGAQVTDNVSGAPFTIKAHLVVNACGPWVDLLRKEDNSLRGKRLQLTKGVHIVLPYKKLPVKQAAYIDVGDGRMIFLIPRNNITYVGTTDTTYNQDIDSPRCTRSDAEYLLKAVKATFKGVDLSLSDIESSWAGLRPLIHEDGKSPSELSRKDEIMISPTGLVSIAGGKLTGYRLMAEKIVDLAGRILGKKLGKCTTKHYPLSGGEFKNQADFEQQLQHFTQTGMHAGIPLEKVNEWFYRYGTNTEAVIALAKQLNETYPVKDVLYLAAELHYTIKYEMVYQLNDFLIRRTGKIFFDKPESEKRIVQLTQLLAQQLNLSQLTAEQILANTRQEYEAVTGF